MLVCGPSQVRPIHSTNNDVSKVRRICVEYNTCIWPAHQCQRNQIRQSSPCKNSSAMPHPLVNSNPNPNSHSNCKSNPNPNSNADRSQWTFRYLHRATPHVRREQKGIPGYRRQRHCGVESLRVIEFLQHAVETTLGKVVQPKWKEAVDTLLCVSTTKAKAKENKKETENKIGECKTKMETAH